MEEANFNYILIIISIFPHLILRKEISSPVENVYIGDESFDFSNDSVLVSFFVIRGFNEACSQDEKNKKMFLDVKEFNPNRMNIASVRSCFTRNLITNVLPQEATSVSA